MQLSGRTGWGLAALGAVLATVVACSSANNGFNDIGGGFATASAPPDFNGPSGTGATLPPRGGSAPASSCPASAPVEGENCFEGTCEYGSAADPACNVIARCDQNRRSWTLDQPIHCPATCPGHFDERAPGTHCSGADVCTYLEATCGCAGAIDGAWTTISGGSNNIADGGAEASTDGGGVAPTAIGDWRCVRPGNGCPARRPVEGTQCSKAIDCDYGTCVFGVPLAMTCVGGRWTPLFVGSCP